MGYSLARGLAIDQWAKELGQPVDELERADTLTQEQTHWDGCMMHWENIEATGCKDNNYSIVVHDGGCRCGCSKDYVDTSYLDLGCEGNWFEALHPIRLTSPSGGGRLSFSTTKAPPSSTKVIEPMTTEEGPECLDLGIPLVGVREECIKVSVDNNTVVVVGQGDKDFMQERGFEKYVCSIDVSDKVYKISDIKACIIKDTGLLQLAIPKLKPEDVTFDVKVDVLMSS
ncbi:mitochondrion heat shock 22 kDa protein [Tanacetum coccineum]